MFLKRKIKKRGIIFALVLLFGLAIFPAKKLMAESIFGRTDWTLLQQVLIIIKTQFVEKEVDDKKLIYGAIRGMLKGLADPYSRFIEPKAFDDMTAHIEGEFYGVGIQIGLKDDWLTVIAPIDGTPASKAGLLSMDKIVKVDGKSTEGISTQEAVSWIRGEKGTGVVLTIKREGEALKDYKIIRAKVDFKAVSAVELFDEKIGYIQLNSFESGKTDTEIEAAIEKLSEMDGLIMDLRNNGGGLLEQAIHITSLFLPPQKDVVYTIDREGTKTVFKTDDIGLCFKKPLVVLINGASASASEIFAGAMQDYKRGKLIGEKTFGKASVQNVRPLSDGSAVLVTIARYYTPKGQDIHKKGLAPDIEEKVPSATYQEIREGTWVYSYDKDTQLQAAIAYLKKKI